MPNPLLSTIQTAVKTRLDAIPYLIGIEVVTEDKGDIVSLMNAAMLKHGVGILVQTPAAFASKENVPGPYFYNEAGGVKIMVQVFENVAVNRGSQGSQKPAPTIAETICAALHLYTPPDLAIITIDPGAPTIASDFENGILIYEVNMQTHGGIVLE